MSEQFKTTDEATPYLMSKFVTRGIVLQEQIDAEVDNIVAAIPTATRDAYGEDKYVAAANFYPTYEASFVSNEGGNQGEDKSPVNVQNGTPNVPAARAAKEAYERPALTDSQQAAMASIIEASQAARIRNTPLTKIVKLLVRYPLQSSYANGRKVVPKCTPENLAKYEKDLVQTPENMAAFKLVKEAVEGNKPMEVYINDKNVKVEGARISTPAIGEGKTNMEEIVLTNEQLAGFLITRVIGRIPNDPVVGVELRTMSSAKAKRHGDASVKVARPTLRWVGRTQALENFSANAETTCEVSKVGNKEETRKVRMRINESFQINNGTNQKGEVKTRTVRLTGELADAPKFRRKEEFRSILGELSDSQTLSAVLSPEEKSAALQTSIDMISSAVASQLQGGLGSYGEEFQNMVKQIAEAANTTNTAAGQYE